MIFSIFLATFFLLLQTWIVPLITAMCSGEHLARKHIVQVHYSTGAVCVLVLDNVVCVCVCMCLHAYVFV